MSGPVSTILSLCPACLNKLTSSLFFFKMKILLHGTEVGIRTLTVVAEPKCHEFWVTPVPAASKPGSISLQHKLGLQQNAASQTKPQLVNVTTNALRKDETIPVLTQIQNTLESKVTFSFRWAKVAEQHNAHQNIKCFLLLLSLLPSSPRHSWAKMSLFPPRAAAWAPGTPSASTGTAPQPLGWAQTISPQAPLSPTFFPNLLLSISHGGAPDPKLEDFTHLHKETLLQASRAVANYCW